MEGKVRLEMGLLFEGVQHRHGSYELALPAEDFHPGDPISGMIGADLMVLHVEIDLHLVADGQSIVHEVLEEVFLVSRGGTTKALFEQLIALHFKFSKGYQYN
jgi:hypothetical protein